MVKHQEVFHCGEVRFEVDAPGALTVNECNCSVCSKSGYLHLIVPASRFRLVQGNDNLTTYTFNTNTAKHYFCNICGIKSFYVSRSHPDGFSVNARCIDSDTIDSMTIRQTNGREWEKAYPAGRGSFE
jgi:hypothetical protein